MNSYEKPGRGLKPATHRHASPSMGYPPNPPLQRRGFVILSLVIIGATAVNGAAGRSMLQRDFDVTTFGARADGTHDNSPAIERALAAAEAAGGGRVVLPPAAQPYLITDSIRIQASRIHLHGEGATVLLKDGAATGRTSDEDMLHIVRIQGTPERPIEHVTLTGLAIDANYWGQMDNPSIWQKAAAQAGIIRGIKVNHARHVRVRDVTIDRPFVGMTFGLGSHHCEAENVKVTRFHHDGFGVTPEFVGGGASHIIYRNCVAADSPNGSRGGLPGNRIKGWEVEEGAQHVQLIDCVVRDTSANGFYIRPHGAPHPFRTGHIQLTRCRVENAGLNAFAVFGYKHEQPVSHVRLVDCVARHGTLAVYLNPDHVSVSGGHFGQVTVGFYRDYDDPHHLVDGPRKDLFSALPVRSADLEDVEVDGDVRINTRTGHDGVVEYRPRISLSRLKVAGDVHVVGPPENKPRVEIDDSSVAGSIHHVTTHQYFQPLHDAMNIPAMRESAVGYTDRAPMIDGDGRDACWAAAPRMDIVNQYERARGRRGGHTFLHVCYDAEALYVLMECLESDMDKLVTTTTDRDADLWFDDNVELFLHRSDDPKTYFRQWMVSVAGAVYDGDETDAERWNSAIRATVKKYDDRYVAEIALPWKDLGGPPRRGEKLKANFIRNRATNDTRWIWSWRYDGEGAFKDISRMGTLTVK